MPQCGCCGPGACAAFSLQGPHPQDLLPACRYVPAGEEHFEIHLIQSSLLFLPKHRRSSRERLPFRYPNTHLRKLSGLLHTFQGR